MSFTPQDAQLAFAVLSAASCSTDATDNILQPLLVRASSTTATCPLLLALRDIVQKKREHPEYGASSSNPQEAAQTVINLQLQQYENELKDSERQCEPLKIARDKLKAELQRVETLLHNAESASRRANDGVLVCRSLLQSIAQNSDAGFDANEMTRNVVGTTNNNNINTQSTNQVSAHGATSQQQLAGQSQPTASNRPSHNTTSTSPSSSSMPSNNQPSIPSSQQQQKHHEDPQPNAQSPQPVPPTSPAVNNTTNINTPTAPISIDSVIEYLKKSRDQGRDDEHRARLIPGLAKVERRVSSNQQGVMIEVQHGELATAVMSSVQILHESVRVHALRAVLAMLRKIAEEPNCIAASSSTTSSQNDNNNTRLSSRLYRAGFTSCIDEQGLRTFISLFTHSPNDDVKAEVLECLGVVAGEAHFVEVMTNLGIVSPLVQLIATSTSEPILERALLLFWSLAQVSDVVKDQALQNGAVRALVDLLYTDSLPILENTMISLGYMSREDRGRVSLSEGGGLEKMVSCLYHPNASVVIKAAGVVWNAAVIDGNRTQLRSLGAVPALLQLLRNTKSELAQENIAGALWNLTIDAEAKKQVADYEGLQLLVALLNNPDSSENILENVTGTLWNCSATIDNRAALRRHGALVPLLRLLSHSAVRIQENAASAIRNLVINDHNKVAVRESGGIEMIVSRLENSWSEIKMHSINGNSNGNSNHTAILGVIDKLATTLWILTVTPENRQRLQPALGLLLDFVGSDILTVQTREKVIGTLRNCGGYQENRKPLVQLGAFSVISNFAASLGLSLPTDAIPSVTTPPVNTSITLRENMAFTIWHLAREDREAGRRSGALGVVTALLGDKNDNVLEPAAGAVAALINSQTNEGRNDLGSLGGVSRLIDVLSGVLSRITSPSFNSSNPNLIVLLHNVLHALRYSTSSGCDANISRLLDKCDGGSGTSSSSNIIEKVTSIIILNGPINNGSSAGAVNSDDVTREAVLLLKNVFNCSSDSRAVRMKNEYVEDKEGFMRRLDEIVAQAQSNTNNNQSNSSQNDASTLLYRAATTLKSIMVSSN